MDDYLLISNSNFDNNTYLFSFSGGGFIGLCYHFGIIQYLFEKEILNKIDVICFGASAGSWASLLLLYLKYNLINNNQYEFYNIKKKFYEFVINLEPKFNGMPVNCKDKIIDFFNKLSFDHKFIEYLHNKLFISISEYQNIFKLKNIIINPKNKEILINSLIDSSKLPVFITLENNFKRFDGSFTNNQPLPPNYDKNNFKKTIKINCLFKYKCDISPSKFVNPIFICKKPSIDKMNEIINLGFNDASNFKFI